MDDDGEDEVRQLARRQRRRRIIALTLGISVTVGIASAVWLLLLRRPSPSAICESVRALVTEDVETPDEKEDQVRLAHRVADGLPVDHPHFDFDGACETYFRTLEGSTNMYGDDRYGFMLRCVALARSAGSALECIDDAKMYEGDASSAVLEFRNELRDRQPREKP